MGDLVGTVLAAGSRNRRAGELLAGGMPAAQVPGELGCAAEALDFVPLLVDALGAAGIDCPATGALGDLIAGGPAAEGWLERLSGTPAEGDRRAA